MAMHRAMAAAMAKAVERIRSIQAACRDPQQLQMLEEWLRSYRPEELFDANGSLLPDLRQHSPQGSLRMGSNPHANGGLLRRNLRFPPLENYAVAVAAPGAIEAENTVPLAQLIRDLIKLNSDAVRVFGPDETASNRLQAIYGISAKVWMEQLLPEDADGGELNRDGRVV
jgi:xylulose-5-phosphate/fructose-6-phosphate phosphoketolase